MRTRTIAVLLTLGMFALAGCAVPISSDSFTNPTSAHRTEVEPDSFAYGSTIVSAFQVGRFFDGGASDIGWATSSDGGAHWKHGVLPGVTTFAGAGRYDRASDAAVAYDVRRKVWLIVSLAVLDTDAAPATPAVLVSRSTDGGFTWSKPVTVASVPAPDEATAGLDKTWIACDTTATSAYYGHCYVQWDDFHDAEHIGMATSTNGGVTWDRANVATASGVGGQPVVQPGGTVIVPYLGAAGTLQAIRSTDGGVSFTGPATITTYTDHAVAGGLRTEPLPSAEIDGAGRVYVVWQDCRFRSGCPNAPNDIVMSTSTDGVTWSAVRRIPIDGVASGVDHFIPGLAVDRATSGTSAHLALVYYAYPNAECDVNTCRLQVGSVSSINGGASWSAPTRLAGPMSLNWLAPTSSGLMVGDYISASIVNGTAHAVFAVAHARPTSSTYDEAIATATVPVNGGAAVATTRPSTAPAARAPRHLRVTLTA